MVNLRLSSYAISAGEPLVLTVVYLELCDAKGNVAVTLQGGTDLPRTFFRIEADPDEPALTAESSVAPVSERLTDV